MEGTNPIPVGSEQAARTDAPDGGEPRLILDKAGAEPLAPSTTASLNGEPRRLLRRDDLRGKATRRYMILDPPEGEDYAAVRLQSLSAAEREEYEESFNVTDRRTGIMRQELKHMRVRLVRMTAVDENGALVFAAEDESWLGEMDGAFIDWIFSATARLSKITKRDVGVEAKN